MATIIEKDSPTSALLLIVVGILLFIGGGVGVAYMSGVFPPSTSVIENNKTVEVNKTVENKTVVVPEQAPPPREVAPEAPKPEPPPTH